MIKLASISILLKKVFNRLILLLTIIPDYTLYILSSQKEPTDKYIVFVGMYMHARIARLAKWLKKNGYKSVLVAQKSAFTPHLSNNTFETTFLFRNKWHLLKIMKAFKGDNVIIHCFGPPHLAAYQLIKKNKGLTSFERQKVIFDFQDLMVTNFGLTPPFLYMKQDIKREKFILNNTNGIVSHSLELQTAKRFYGKVKTPKLFFPLYTDNELFERKEVIEGSELNLVYVGGVHSKFKNKDYFGAQHLHWLIEKLNKQKIHLHVYPAPTNREEDLVDYIKLDRQLNYFHMHKPVPQQQLIKEINNYDYGVIPFFHKTNKKLNDKRYYSTSMKLFNFFEAGIPVIIGEDTTFQNFIANHYGAGIQVKYDDFDDLKNILKKYDYKSIVRKLQEQREKLSLKNKIQLMIQFYEKI